MTTRSTFDRGAKAAEFRALVNGFYKGYGEALAFDADQARAALQPGKALPARRGNEFMTPQGRERAKELCGGYLTKLENLVAEARADLRGCMADAPSDEALRAIQAVRMNDTIEPAILQALEDRYGADNYLCHRAIARLAMDRGIPLSSANETATNEAALDNLGRQIIGSLDCGKVARSPLGVDSLRALALQACEGFEAGSDGDVFDRRTGTAGVDPIPDGATVTIGW